MGLAPQRCMQLRRRVREGLEQDCNVATAAGIDRSAQNRLYLPTVLQRAGLFRR